MTTKRVVVASLVAVLAAASPAWAIFVGDLKQNTTVRIVVQNNSPGDRAAMTVLLINRRDDFSEVTPYTVGPGATGAFSATIGARIDRMILLVSPPARGSVSVTVEAAPTVDCEGDCRLEFDTIP